MGIVKTMVTSFGGVALTEGEVDQTMMEGVGLLWDKCVGVGGKHKCMGADKTFVVYRYYRKGKTKKRNE